MAIRLDPARAPRTGRMLALALGAAGAAAAFALLPGIAALVTAAFWLLVLVVVRSDLASLTIPDEASLAILGLGLAAAGLAAEDGATAAIAAAALSGAGAFTAFWALAALYRRLRGVDGIGFGDVKLAGALGVWLDPAGQALALQLAALAALGLVAVARLRGAHPQRSDAVPFGAFLAPAAFAVHLAAALAPGLTGLGP